MSNHMRIRIAKQAMMLHEKGIMVSEIIRTLSCLYPRESKENIEMIMTNTIEMTRSLMVATNQAGGGGWSSEELDKMTAIELISILAPNNVRFIYTKTNHCTFKKLEEIRDFAEEMIEEFNEILEEDPNNLVAETGIEIYKEFIEKLSI